MRNVIAPNYETRSVAAAIHHVPGFNDREDQRNHLSFARQCTLKLRRAGRSNSLGTLTRLCVHLARIAGCLRVRPAHTTAPSKLSEDGDRFQVRSPLDEKHLGACSTVRQLGGGRPIQGRNDPDLGEIF